MQVKDASHTQRCNSSKEAWDKLIKIFKSQDVVTKIYLMDNLSSLTMKENDQLIHHIQKFQTIMVQLNARKAPMDDGDAMLNLMRSLPISY